MLDIDKLFAWAISAWGCVAWGFMKAGVPSEIHDSQSASFWLKPRRASTQLIPGASQRT